MRSYIVTYHLFRKEEHYSELIDMLKSFPAWWHKIDNVWMIRSEKSAKDLYNILKDYIYDDDILLINALQVDAAWQGVDRQTEINFHFTYKLREFLLT